jgi:hypothetical protein
MSLSLKVLGGQPASSVDTVGNYYNDSLLTSSVKADDTTAGASTVDPATIGLLASVASGASKFLQSLGLKGKTQHANFSNVTGPASAAATEIYNKFVSVYGAVEAPKVAALMSQNLGTQMGNWWGLGPSLNQQILSDSQQNSGDLSHQLWLFFLWVYTNVDQNQSAETNGNIVSTLYNLIFITAIDQDGLDHGLFASAMTGVAYSAPPSKGTNGGTGGVIITPGSGAPSVNVQPSGASIFGSLGSNTLILILIAGAVAFAIFRRS